MEEPVTQRGNSRFRTFVLVASGLAMAWGAGGALDVTHQSYSGFRVDRSSKVVRVTEDSPASRAGFVVGDVIEAIDGTAWYDTRARATRSRPDIGETRTFQVSRGAKTISLPLTYAARPARPALVAWGGIALGVVLLVCGVWAYLTVPTLASRLLAGLGLALSPALMAGPYFGSAGLRSVLNAAALVALVAGFAFLAHLLLVFPKPKAFLRRPSLPRFIYVPGAFVALLGCWLSLLQPDGRSLTGAVFGMAFGIFVAACFGIGVIAAIHTFAKASASERRAHGLSYILGGTVVGLGPSFLVATLNSVAPSVALPGAQFYFLTMAVLPMAFAWAATRQGREAIGSS